MGVFESMKGGLGYWIRRWKGWWWQRRFPSPWRISPPPWPSWSWGYLERICQSLENSRRERPTSEPLPESAAKPGEPPPSEQWLPLSKESAASVGNCVFRMRELSNSQNQQSPDEQIRLFTHHTKILWDGLAEAGFQIHDHTGEVLPESGACELNILTFQPTPGICQSVVLETIKPSIWYRKQLIQRAQVVVGIPPESAEP